MKDNKKAAQRKHDKFLNNETIGGLVMIGTAILAMLAANSPLSEWYHSFTHMDLGFSFGALSATASLSHWVKDVLMVFFFLLVGMELKREIMEGFLADRAQVILPLVAAIGGMVAPAAVYLFINRDVPANAAGWAIPSATDIAFAVCVLMLVGRSVPAALKIFLLAIAIFDDLGAILIIAFFYSSGITLVPLLWVAGCIGALIVLNKLKVMSISVYLAAGVALWFALYHSGIHTTIGGVLVGMAIPMRNPEDRSHSPLNTCLHFLHPWVSFLILPIFAFTSAGVSLHGEGVTLFNPLAAGIALGLFIGKQIGIFGGTYAMVKCGLCKLPEHTNWRHIYGVSLLAGIGFTMSLFISMLAFPGADQATMRMDATIGILGGSVLSALVGFFVLHSAKATPPLKLP